MSDRFPPSSHDHPTSSPGAILKRCREYHGISLEEAAEATKIGINYLSALEADQVKEFANLAYLKGFLRIYAAHLGLNADDMTRLYEKLYAPPRQKNGTGAQTGDDADSLRRKRFSWRKLILPAFLLLLLIITSFLMNRSNRPAPPQTAQQPATTTAVVPVQAQPSSARGSAPPAPEKRTASPEQQEQRQPEPSAPQKTPVETAKGFIVRMKVIHNGTLAVTIDGSAAQNYDLAVGDVIEWKADKSVALELSNAGGVEVELNGKPLKPLGPEGKPGYITLDSEGIRP